MATEMVDMWNLESNVLQFTSVDQSSKCASPGSYKKQMST